ncbi:MAG: hypothetical protein J7L35_01780 [Anaerolineales bacterium]|nr:hypothetical protein [Anaerolineales bacterium]
MTELSNNNAIQIEEVSTIKRPRLLTGLGWFFLLVSIFHFLKFTQTIRNIELLQSLPMAISPLYLAGDGLIWGLSGMVLAWGLWKGKRWSSPAAIILSLFYSLAFWADRIWIAEPESLALRWPVNLVLTISVFGLIVLVLTHKTSRAYFRKNPAKIP